MFNYKENYNKWLEDNFFDEETREELSNITDEKEIEDRFYRDLEFGTGGLRGVMGAGTNRMNKYTIGKATKGLGMYLLDHYGVEACAKRGVVIGHDTRNNSKDFSEITANVLTGMGIKVYLHSEARPTPQLSFSVKFLNALAGVVITASHNPKEYNGYKVYDEYGCQLVPWQAKQVIQYVNAIEDYHTISFEGNNSLLEIVEVTDNFVSEVMKQSRYEDATAKADLKVVYTPLHGTGYVPVTKALALDGFKQIEIVKEQAVMDGNFPTVVSPNPEDRRALEIGIQQAKKTDADIVLGTDPDSDRVGIAVKGSDGSYQLVTGNQVGALLVNFILKNTDLSKYSHPAIVKTIVTSELGADIARKQGINVFSTLTGFKFIGEKITQFEQAKLKENAEQNYDFLFGYADTKVIIITDDNVEQYVKFPSYIIEKLEKGTMSTAAFSDLLRFSLLEHYGGTWIDSTVYLTDKLPEYVTKSDLFAYQDSFGLIRNPALMSVWLLHSTPNNEVIRETRNIAFEYWKNQNYVVEYLLPYIILTMVLKEHSEYFSKMPYANSDYTHLMLEHINEEYDEKLTNHILSLSSVHKLSYKLKHEAYANKENLYHRIIESYSRGGGKDTRVK